MSYQNFLFDLYGTLVDIHTDETLPSLWAGISAFYTLHDAPYRPEELREAYFRLCGRALQAAAVRLSAEQAVHAEPDLLQVFQALFREKGIHPGTAPAANAALLFRTLSLNKLRLFPDAIETLQGLRSLGKHVYLISNAQACFTLPELDVLGLTEYFDGIVISSEVGSKKPGAEIFRQTLERFGLRAQDCIMTGNDVTADCEGAEALGMASRYIHTEQSPFRPEKLPENCREIHALRELL